MMRHKSAGFTIVELLIATLAFSVILLVIAGGIISMSRSYYKGVNASSTQNTAANILNRLTQVVQLGTANVSISQDPTNLWLICAGSQEYFFKPGLEVVQGAARNVNQNFGVYQHQKAAADSCANVTDVQNSGNLPAGGQELLSEGMHLLKLTLSNSSGGGSPNSCGSGQLCRMAISIGYGRGDDLFCDSTVTVPSTLGSCASGAPIFTTTNTLSAYLANHYTTADIRCKTQLGSQFCTISSLQTTVQRRL